MNEPAPARTGFPRTPSPAPHLSARALRPLALTGPRGDCRWPPNRAPVAAVGSSAGLPEEAGGVRDGGGDPGEPRLSRRADRQAPEPPGSRTDDRSAPSRPVSHGLSPRPAAPLSRDRRCGGVSWPGASRDPLAGVRAARGCGCRRGMEQWRGNAVGAGPGPAARSGVRRRARAGPPRALSGWRRAPASPGGRPRWAWREGRQRPGPARRYRWGLPAAASLRGCDRPWRQQRGCSAAALPGFRARSEAAAVGLLSCGGRRESALWEPAPVAAGAAVACPGYGKCHLIPVIQISGSGESKASSPTPCVSPRLPLRKAWELSPLWNLPGCSSGFRAVATSVYEPWMQWRPDARRRKRPLRVSLKKKTSWGLSAGYWEMSKSH